MLYLELVELRAGDAEGQCTLWACDPVDGTVYAPFSMLPSDLSCAAALVSGAVVWDTQEPYVRADFLLEQIETVEPKEWERLGMTRAAAVAKIEHMITTVRACAIK